MQGGSVANILYVGTKKGFIRFRRENGAGWRLDGRSLEGLDVARLLLQPEQGRLWAATHGRGVLVSHDGGDTWDAVSPPEMAKAHAIYAQPGAPDVLYAGTEPAAIWK